MNIYQKISAIMKAVQYLGKDDTVGVGNSKYRAISEEKVTMAIREQMIIHGVVIVPVERKFQREDHWYMVEDNYGKKEKVSRISTCETVYKIINIEDPKDFVTVASGGTGVDTQDKGIGKAMTYDYKYMLLRTFAIPTGEDPDKISSSETDQKIAEDQKTEPKVTKPESKGEEDLASLQGKAMGYHHALVNNKILDFGGASRFANEHLGVTKADKSTDPVKLKKYIEECKKLLEKK